MKQYKFILRKAVYMLLITLLLIILKLYGFISVSWMWVLSSLWLPLVFMGIMLLLLFTLVLTLLLYKK